MITARSTYRGAKEGITSLKAGFSSPLYVLHPHMWTSASKEDTVKSARISILGRAPPETFVEVAILTPRACAYGGERGWVSPPLRFDHPSITHP